MGPTSGSTFVVVDENGPAPVYTLTDDADGRFTINSSGDIRVANGAAIDFETAPGHAYSVTAKGTVGDSSASQTFSITVNNINEEPQGTNNSSNLQEDASYTFTAADFGFSDPGDNPTPNNFAGLVIAGISVPAR